MRADLLQLAADLARRGEPFALSIVVRRQSATSAHLGDMAVITEDGAFHGWVGGSCTQPALLREARKALADGAPRLVSLSPDPDADSRHGVTPLALTCASGGSVDIYVQPVLPSPRLLVFGSSATCQALARLGKAMGYAVEVADPLASAAMFPEADEVHADMATPRLRMRPPHESRRLSVVVATMGQRDEEATGLALALQPAYLGVVASRKRFEQIRETLSLKGIPAASLDRIANPAGLDIGAQAPEEVALSILAEIVKRRRAAAKTASEPKAAGEAKAAADERDPVCGMTVAVASAAHTAEVGGRTYYFCCGGCRERFLAAPDRYGAGGAA
jgi:xanthine dehydrogenase accessory factor